MSRNLHYKTKLVMGFPGVGKSYFCKHSTLNILDAESSEFDKKKFPQNYIEYIKSNLGKIAIILISSHDVVRNELVRQGIPFTLVYPNRPLKEEYQRRYRKRGDHKSFIQLFEDNWHKWITELQNQNNCIKIELNTGQYLSDIKNFKEEIIIVDKKKELLELFSQIESLPNAEEAIDGLLSEAQEIKDYYYKLANALPPKPQPKPKEKQEPKIKLKNCMHIIATEPHIPYDPDG